MKDSKGTVNFSTLTLTGYEGWNIPSVSMTPFGSARDVFKFESSSSASFARFQDVLQHMSVAIEKPPKKTFWRKPLYQRNSPLRKQRNEATVWNISERAKQKNEQVVFRHSIELLLYEQPSQPQPQTKNRKKPIFYRVPFDWSGLLPR